MLRCRFDADALRECNNERRQRNPAMFRGSRRLKALRLRFALERRRIIISLTIGDRRLYRVLRHAVTGNVGL